MKAIIIFLKKISNKCIKNSKSCGCNNQTLCIRREVRCKIMGKDGEKEAMKCPQDEGGKQRKKLGRPARVVQKSI